MKNKSIEKVLKWFSMMEMKKLKEMENDPEWFSIVINSNDLNKILNEYLGKTNIQPRIEVFNDRKYSKRGWQYKKYGNSTAGYDKLMKCKQEMEELDYICKDTRNDYDLRAYQTYIFYANNSIVTANTSPSRSGSSCEYIFKTYKEES